VTTSGCQAMGTWCQRKSKNQGQKVVIQQRNIGHDIVHVGDMDRCETACVHAVEHEGEAVQQAPGRGRLGL